MHPEFDRRRHVAMKLPRRSAVHLRQLSAPFRPYMPLPNPWLGLGDDVAAFPLVATRLEGAAA
jgi:hypothetical protein